VSVRGCMDVLMYGCVDAWRYRYTMSECMCGCLDLQIYSCLYACINASQFQHNCLSFSLSLSLWVIQIPSRSTRPPLGPLSVRWSHTMFECSGYRWGAWAALVWTTRLSFPACRSEPLKRKGQTLKQESSRVRNTGAMTCTNAVALLRQGPGS